MNLKMKQRLTKFLVAAVIGSLVVLLILLLAQQRVMTASKGKIYRSLADVPEQTVGLVFGTAAQLREGVANPYFITRIEAAVALFKSGKVQHLIVSGDNGQKDYNEPADMRNALIEAGIPAMAITLDYAGFRTLDSVVRCREVFQQNKVTLITQEFHAHRALYLASSFDLDAIAFIAIDPSWHDQSTVGLREYLARAKAWLDVAFGVGPRFLGEEVDLPV